MTHTNLAKETLLQFMQAMYSWEKKATRSLRNQAYKEMLKDELATIFNQFCTSKKHSEQGKYLYLFDFHLTINQKRIPSLMKSITEIKLISTSRRIVLVQKLSIVFKWCFKRGNGGLIRKNGSMMGSGSILPCDILDNVGRRKEMNFKNTGS